MEEWDRIEMTLTRALLLHSPKEEWDRPRIKMDQSLYQPMGGQGETYDNMLEVIVEEQ